MNVCGWTYVTQRVLVGEATITCVALGVIGRHLDVVSPSVAAGEVAIAESAIRQIDVEKVRHIEL